ncbi:MAG: hypothetical protein WBD20_01575 [Pirellulaceae bacterium]
MKSSRTLAVYLTLAALLFSNVAGWVHVGCSGHLTRCGHSAGCCDSTSNVACTLASTTAQQDCCEHSCCQHDHVAPTLPPIEFPAEIAVDTHAEESDSDTPAEQHDSDSCSICQSFFASRHAVTLVDPIVAIERLAVTCDAPLVDDVVGSNPLSRSHTVRGPPSV